MDKYALLNKNPKVCRRVFGMDLVLLENLLEKVKKESDRIKEENPLSHRGLKAEMSFNNQFLLSLEYLKSYQTFQVLGFSYGVSESYACKIYHTFWVLLAGVVGLKNPDKLSYKKIKTVWPPSRLKDRWKDRKKHSTSKKKYIIKAQILINEKNGDILHCKVEKEGVKSVMRVFWETELEIDEKITLKADSAYQAIDKIHFKSRGPFKRPKAGIVTKKQKRYNKKLRKKKRAQKPCCPGMAYRLWTSKHANLK